MLESFKSGKFTYKRIPLEEQKSRGILGRLAGIIADTKEPTRNGRHYGLDLWKNVFENPIMKEKIANHLVLGELGHPEGREETDISKAAICLAEQPKISDDGKIYGVFDILSTPNGHILKSLCDYGCHIGISSRGTGDLIDGVNGQEVDPDTYNCECWDAVIVPAVESARLTYVTEALDTTKYKKTLRQKLSEDLENAEENDRAIMKEALDKMGIDLGGEEESVEESYSTSKSKEELIKSFLDSVDESDAFRVVVLDHDCNDIVLDYTSSTWEDGAPVLKRLRSSSETVRIDLHTGDKVIVCDEDDDVYIPVVGGWGKTSLSTLDIEVPVEEHIQKLRATQLEEGKVKDGIKNFTAKVKDKLSDHTWDEFEDAPEEIDTDNPDELFAYLDQMDEEDQEDFLKEFYDITQDQIDELLKEYDIRKYNAKANADPDYFYKMVNRRKNESINEALTSEQEEELWDMVQWLVDNFEEAGLDFKDVFNEFKSGCDATGADYYSIIKDIYDYYKDMMEFDPSKNESISESCGDKDDVKEEVVNDKSDEFAAELQEALSKNKKLEKDNLSLQEKLSVCTAKEAKLEEELKKYKASTAHLSETAKKVRPLKRDLNSLTEELEKKDSILKANKTRFNELVDTANEAIAKLEESNKVNKNLKNKVKNLNEQLEATQVKVDNSQALVKKYQKALRESRDELVQAKADAYGIEKDDILSNLNESYNLKQLNSVCEELQDRKRNLSKLPFRVNSTSKMQIKEAKETITGRDSYMNDDDYVSDSLLDMLK